MMLQLNKNAEVLRALLGSPAYLATEELPHPNEDACPHSTKDPWSGVEQQLSRAESVLHIAVGPRRLTQRVFTTDPNLELPL